MYACQLGSVCICYHVQAKTSSQRVEPTSTPVDNTKGDADKPCDSDSDVTAAVADRKPSYWARFRERVRGNHALQLDVISRVMFPLTFVMFNVIYWSYYGSKDS